MMPNHPMYGHQHFPQDAPWMHPAQSHHQHAQAQQAAAAAAAAQQAHYSRINSSSNHANALNPVHQDASADNPNMTEDNRRTMQYIADLLNENSREQALLELSKKREQVPELALILWHSFGVMTSLVQEIISVYTLLNPSQLTAAASNRVCNALALLQCVASHNETRTLFLNAHIPLYLYPFLNTTSKSRPFEYLRLTSLGVIGALVKNDSSEVINFLLTTEIIPLCLRIMETGSELSKTVAIFIVQKILLDDNGLNYICATYERFYAVGTVLSNMVGQLVEQQTARLLKHVVRCFLRTKDSRSMPEEDSYSKGAKGDVELQGEHQAKDCKVEGKLEAEAEPATSTGANAVDGKDNGSLNDHQESNVYITCEQPVNGAHVEAANGAHRRHVDGNRDNLDGTHEEPIDISHNEALNGIHEQSLHNSHNEQLMDGTRETPVDDVYVNNFDGRLEAPVHGNRDSQFLDGKHEEPVYGAHEVPVEGTREETAGNQL
ncbi:putative cell differentiation protein rcd1 [Diaporthe ampelina]|uniref:Putative cell differentiation protein rcd1 n=1 Tax=Diaporthe ampelina TaxID=1214573 RepID=A0A0G2HVJ4_9PEZI|nr:putative cell differentiation protein rcd1 [Diaporthe ampelina]